MKTDREKLEALRREYLETEIPPELPGIVYAPFLKRKRSRLPQQMLCLAACLCLIFVGALNLNPAFAAAAAQVPVIGAVAQVLTFSEYHVSTDRELVDVRVPEITGTSFPELEDRINEEIQKKIDDDLAAARERAQEEYDAYVATGGDPNDYIPMTISFDYEVKSCTDEILSFELERFEVRASGFSELTYYNIDLITGETLTLADVLGPDWKERADAVVYAAIDQNPENFFSGETGGFSGVSEDQRFYINEDGNAVIVFEKYEIAPGASGTLEFEIPTAEN